MMLCEKNKNTKEGEIINTELEKIHGEIMKATKPEDIFGALLSGNSEEQLDRISRIYRQLVKTVFPDHYRGTPKEFEMAGNAYQALNKFRDDAKAKINGGNAAETEDDEFVIKRPQQEYRINSRPIAEGDLSIVYRGYYPSSETGVADSVVVKLIKDPTDMDLMRNEARIVKMLQDQPSNQSKHLPELLDQFKTTDRRSGLIFRCIDGYDLHSVREKYTNGVPEKHMVWMLNRLLSALGYAHSKGIVHCNVEPAHLMVRPYDHNLCLIDWSYAVFDPFATGEGFKVLNEDFSAPEVGKKLTPTPSADLYSVGKCMIYVLGGDVKTNKMPNSVNAELQRFISAFVRESPIQRPRDAWLMRERLIELIENLWGPRKFLNFEM